MEKKVRLLYTISNFNTAGSGKVIHDLVSNLNPDKFDISVACGSDKGDYIKILKSLDIKIYIIRTNLKLKPYFSLYTRLKPTVKFLHSNFDIVHSWYWSSNWSEILACRMAGVKYIYTKKSMGYTSKHWKIKSLLANYIITVNDEMKGLLPNKSNTQLIPFGLDTEYYKRPHSLKKSPQSKAFHIVTVANLVPIKGVELVIESVRDLTDKNVKLTIVGDDVNDYSLSLKKLVFDYSLENQITFTGKLLDIRAKLIEADLFVLPTLGVGEGMPMALVEAMSMELVVLGSNVAGINYVLKDFPKLLFEKNNVPDLVDKIIEIINMDESSRKLIGKNLRKYCVQHFSMANFIKSHEELYHSILK